MNRLAIVVPCYNEEEIFNDSNTKLLNLLESLIADQLVDQDSVILYVNDGSKDNTWSLIDQASKSSSYVVGLKLAGNVGHQNALLAGIDYASQNYDVSVSIDADLQDDILVIKEMILNYQKGYDIVYGVRNERKTDSFFKRFTAQSFYKLMHFLGVKSVYNHADFRLMSNRAMKQLLNYRERNLFLRGLVPLIGYQTTSVYYSRKERLAGESKYPLKKMLSFAFDGITSFSVKPITLIVFVGFFIALISFFMLVYSLIQYCLGNVVSGWTSMFVSIWFLGGLQLIAIGVIGEYIGKTYIEVKARPRYNIEKVVVKQ